MAFGNLQMLTLLLDEEFPFFKMPFYALSSQRAVHLGTKTVHLHRVVVRLFWLLMSHVDVTLGSEMAAGHLQMLAGPFDQI
jgi:hypothetical protein